MGVDPFRPGARRDVKQRAYTVTVVKGQIPAGAEVACRYFAERGVRWLIADLSGATEVSDDALAAVDADAELEARHHRLLDQRRGEGGGMSLLEVRDVRKARHEGSLPLSVQKMAFVVAADRRLVRDRTVRRKVEHLRAHARIAGA